MPDPTVRADAAPRSNTSDDEIQPTWRRSLRDVLTVAALVVAVVLGAALVTDVVPAPIRSLVVDTPLAIVVLIGGTAWLLWRIARRPVDGPPDDGR